MNPCIVIMTQLISIFIYDVGGEFTPKDVRSICECLGEVKKERISDIYTDYFIELGMTPVRALVEEREVEFAGLKASFKKYLKVLVFGVVLVEFQFDFGKPLNFQKLREAASCETLVIDNQPKRLADIAREEFDRVMESASGKFKWTYEVPNFVDNYKIIVDEKLKSKKEICAVILNEDPKTLSDDIIEGMTKSAVRYSKKDAAFVSNTSSYIYSEEFPEDIINIIELSRMQLFELKVYDFILDKQIGGTYAVLEGIPKGGGILGLKLFSEKYRKLSEVAYDLMEMRIELVDSIKDVMNSMKVTNDIFLAFLYRRVNEEFRLEDWYGSVRSKLEELGRAYSMVVDSQEMMKSTTLEMWIVILILLELVVLLVLGV
ncbi:MAG: hypothetical protein HY930_01105 [Euryarchaeota archaeon]|nr:hypothetical protein [Euryarchaeota archaeon]